MIGSAGTVIMFVVSLAAFGMWVVVYSTFVAHYVLTTLTSTSAGANEVEFPAESFISWWWKPVLCAWVLAAWSVPISLACLPLASLGPWPFAIAFLTLLGIIYPLSLASVLHQQNWLILIDLLVIWRMVRQFRLFLAVLSCTSALSALCAALFILAAQRSWLWLALFALILPVVMLMWARYWGRLAWITLNDVPSRRNRKKRRKARTDTVDDALPELDVEVVAESEIEESTSAIAEEEDEWATDKAPYAMEPAASESSPSPDRGLASSVASYYEKRAAREAKERDERAASLGTATPIGRTQPSFREAMFVGMWSFLFQRGAMRAWANLTLMTFAGLFVLALLGAFRPPV